MPFRVYVLRCSEGSYYTGHTDNLEHRIGMHNLGEVESYTRSRRPVRLVFSQECATRVEALGAELQIKGWTRAKKEALFKGDWTAVNRLSRGKHQRERRPS